MVEGKRNPRLDCQLSDLVFGISLGEGKTRLLVPSDTPIIPEYNLFWIGAFGNVRVGWQRSNKTNKYAIKTMKKAEIINSKHVDHIENEKNILEKLQHPFCVSLSLRPLEHLTISFNSWNITDFSKTTDSFTS